MNIKNEKEILCLLRLNKERASLYFDEGTKNFVIRANTKLKKSKYIDSYTISNTEKRYLEVLKLNPNVVLLEYTCMSYYILNSNISRKKIKLPEGMKYSPEKGIYDDKTILNLYESRMD